MVQTLERSRYARPSAQPLTIEPDAARVLHAVAVSRRRQDRVRAAVWPGSGVAALRSASARLSWATQAPTRAVRAWWLRRRS